MSGSRGSTFALSPRAVIALAIGCLALTALAFAAGWLIASRRATDRTGPAEPADPAGAPVEDSAEATEEGDREQPIAAGLPPETSAETSAETSGETWSVRLGAFLVEEEAEVLLAALAERGYQPYQAEVAASDGGRRARTVLVGPYTARADAVRVATVLHEREGLRAVVVRDDPRPMPLPSAPTPTAGSSPPPAAPELGPTSEPPSTPGPTPEAAGAASGPDAEGDEPGARPPRPEGPAPPGPDDAAATPSRR